MAAISLEKAFARLRSLVPGARFFQSGEVSVPASEPGEADHSFHYVSLYEHRIGISVRSIGAFTFIIANGFVTSHAYNLALCWLWYGDAARRRAGTLDSALRHNYKKFFAERATAQRSCLIGRAMLLETLIYEQALMRPIFDAISQEERLGRLARDIASATAQMPSMHELSHLFLRRSRPEFEPSVRAFFNGLVGDAVDRVGARFGPELAEETLCDGFAAHQGVISTESPLAAYDPITRARMTAFVFLVFSDLIALEASAIATAEASVAEDRAMIDLASEKRPKVASTFQLGRLPATEARAAEMLGLLEAYAHREGHDLFGADGVFPLPESTRADLLAAFERFGELIEPSDGGMTGTDAHRRGLAQLVAESLHGHPSGAEFLLWRSKHFSVGGTPVDP